MNSYGKELILDLDRCDPGLFTRAHIEAFFRELCEQIDMQREDRHFWDDVGVPEELCETEPHLKGTSAIQFIKTSNITIHTLDLLGTVYLNVFSCKDFSERVVIDLATSWFSGTLTKSTMIYRG